MNRMKALMGLEPGLEQEQEQEQELAQGSGQERAPEAHTQAELGLELEQVPGQEPVPVERKMVLEPEWGQALVLVDHALRQRAQCA